MSIEGNKGFTRKFPGPYGRRPPGKFMRRQAGDDHVAGLSYVTRTVGPFRTLFDEGLRRAAVEVPHQGIEPLTHQAAREFSSHITQTDKTDFHDCLPCE